MLELRPNCELCDADLPPGSPEARICSYECTFCARCVETVLHDVCPNCGGGFQPRPIRPAQAWRPSTGLEEDPAGTLGGHLRELNGNRGCAFGGHRDPKKRLKYVTLRRLQPTETASTLARYCGVGGRFAHLAG